MTSTAARRLSLVECEPCGARARHAADAAVDAWRIVEAVLVPLVGRLGFNALYQRSLALRSRQDAWLPRALEGTADEDSFAALHLALCGREDGDAAAAQRELLRVFHEVLTSLLGAPLVARLLPPLDSRTHE